jgi:hypothetical protein
VATSMAEFPGNPGGLVHATDRRVKRVVLFAAFGAGCNVRSWQAAFVPAGGIPRMERNAFLECHMRDGDVYVFDSWSVAEAEGFVHGTGVRVDASRVGRSPGVYDVPLADVALLETTRPERVRSTWRTEKVLAPIVLGGAAALAYVAAIASGHD